MGTVKLCKWKGTCFSGSAPPHRPGRVPWHPKCVGFEGSQSRLKTATRMPRFQMIYVSLCGAATEDEVAVRVHDVFPLPMTWV